MKEKDLNRLMAEEVMGWKEMKSVTIPAIHEWWDKGDDVCNFKDWDPLHNIAQAMDCLYAFLGTNPEYVYKSGQNYENDNDVWFELCKDYRYDGALGIAGPKQEATAIVHAIAEALKDQPSKSPMK